MSSLDEPRRTRLLAIGAALALALALLGVSDAIDRAFFANAITVSWRAEDPALGAGPTARFEVTRTIEHRITFSHAHRPVARYVQGWDYHRLPPPMSPPIDALVLADVTIPEGPDLYLGASSSGRHVVTVDGEREPSRAFAPGVHRLEVSWSEPRPSESTHFELEWGQHPDALDPIPRDRLTSDVGAWPPSRRAFWACALAVSLFFALSLARALASLEGARRRRLEGLATAAILLLALGLRLFDYDVMPQYLENGDELFAMWNGWSILNEGVPRGWSLWAGAYAGLPVTITNLSMHGSEWHVIEPYFEHPPLLHLLVGLAATIGGADSWSHARLVHGRLVPIALYTLTTWLVIALSRRIDGRRTASRLAPHLAGLLYAVIPFLSIQGRVIKEEAALTPLLLATTLFFLRWRDDGRRTRDAILAATLAGACMLAKVTGLAAVAGLVALFFLERAYREGLRAGAIGASIASLFPVFGAWVDWRVFVETQRLQGGRPTHYNLFLRFFDDPLINMSLVGRGWLIFLWIGTLATAFRRTKRENAAIYLIPLFYLTAIGLGSGNWTFGWYMMPIFPFLCLGAGRFIADLWEDPDFLRGWLFTLTGVMYGFNFVLDPHFAKQPPSWPGIRRDVTILIALMLVPYTLVTIFPRLRPFARFMTALWVLSIVVLSAHFVVHYDTFYDVYRNFDRDEYFDR